MVKYFPFVLSTILNSRLYNQSYRCYSVFLFTWYSEKSWFHAFPKSIKGKVNKLPQLTFEICSSIPFYRLLSFFSRTTWRNIFFPIKSASFCIHCELYRIQLKIFPRWLTSTSFLRLDNTHCSALGLQAKSKPNTNTLLGYLSFDGCCLTNYRRSLWQVLEPWMQRTVISILVEQIRVTAR